MSTSGSAALPAPDPGRSRKARRDIAVVVAVSAVAALLCVKLNLSEMVLSWTRPEERFQLDELPGILLVVAVCLCWFSARRYAEASRELRLRRTAEARLSEALATNRRLAQQYLDRQESEHRALARDLHDELGQYLNAIRIDAVALRVRLTAVDPADSGALAMIENITRVETAVLGLIRQLRPVGLDELGLRAALEHCVGDWRARLPELAIELSLSERLDGLDERQRLALYRLVQESLTNVARHARARHVVIRIELLATPGTTAEEVTVRIADDGCGTAAGQSGRGLGLVGMRERVEALGGSLAIASAPGAGFTLTARMPASAPSAIGAP
jgi:signal transduction histidine kinase